MIKKKYKKQFNNVMYYLDVLTNAMSIVISEFLHYDQFVYRSIVVKNVDVETIRQRRNSDTDSKIRMIIFIHMELL